MNSKTKLNITLLGNIFLLLLVTIFMFVFDSGDGQYFRFGPSSNLIVVSVVIDTWVKYSIVLSVITLIKVIDTLTNEFGMPILAHLQINLVFSGWLTIHILKQVKFS